MSKFVVIQAGHEGRTSGSTGAPGEVELNVRIRNRLSQLLINKGFMVQLVNADPTQLEINKDFDLFLALHGDADVYGTGGGFVDYPAEFYQNGGIQDYNNAESKRIKEAIESKYFQHSEIANHPERSNANTKYYYMWRQLTPKTPCVLIEMGVVQDAHDRVLLADTDRIANALTRGICKAFDVPYDSPEPQQPPIPPVEPSPPAEPVPPVPEPPQPPTQPVETVDQVMLKQIKEIVWGRGWWWTKVNRIRALLPKEA